MFVTRQTDRCWPFGRDRWLRAATAGGARAPHTTAGRHEQESSGTPRQPIVPRVRRCCAAPASCSRRPAARIAAGPMDGTTWRRYRFIIQRGNEPTFFLEPDHPGDWPEHWSSRRVLAVGDLHLGRDPPVGRRSAPTPRAHVARLSAAGISIRELDSAQPDAELRRIDRLATIELQPEPPLQSYFRRRVPRRQSRLAADPPPGAGPARGA